MCNGVNKFHVNVATGSEINLVGEMLVCLLSISGNLNSFEHRNSEIDNRSCLHCLFRYGEEITIGLRICSEV